MRPLVHRLELGDRAPRGELGSRELRVAQERLETAHIGTVLERQCRRREAKEVTGPPLADASLAIRECCPQTRQNLEKKCVRI
jgi:hypothetical protein